MALALDAAASFLPVLLFLMALRLVDTYQLVGVRSLSIALLGGCLAAVAAYLLNPGIQELLGLSGATFSRYIAPVLEEALKGVVVGALIWKNRVGFLVDAAILGFAVGTGFALAENLAYLASRDLGLATWVVRGFGTAIMHGGATTLFATISKLAVDRRGHASAAAFLPGLALAIVVHSLYNHFLLPPMLSAAVMAVSVPILVAVVFVRSEAATRDWITDGFDADQEVLLLMETGKLSDSRVGHYLRELRARFPGEVLVDMLCLLRLEAELSIRAKGILMMREAGFDPKPDDALRAKVEEALFLEESIGSIGRLALDPFLRLRGRERWQRQVLGVGPETGGKGQTRD